MIVIVLIATIIAGASGAYWNAARAHREQQDRLRRIALTLAEGNFPLTHAVLKQVAGLSGAEFVAVGGVGQIIDSTVLIDDVQARRLFETNREGDRSPSKNKPVTLAGREYLADGVDLQSRGSTSSSGVLFVLMPSDRWTEHLLQALTPAFGAGAVATILAIVASTVLARRFTKPIRALVTQTADVAEGKFAPVATSNRDDELRDLALSINRMAERLAEYENDVRKNERLRTLGQLGAAMAHQLRNAATGGRLAIELHGEECPLRESDEALEVALRQMNLMESYLKRFLAIGKPNPESHRKLDAAEALGETMKLLGPSLAHLNVALRFEPPAAPIFINGDGESLRELFTNLLTNAAEASLASADPSRPGEVEVRIRTLGDGRGEVEIRDDGPGPKEEIRDRLFEAFATGKPDGVGLGLWAARQIAELHDGELTWRRDGQTTVFAFTFPLATQ